MPLRAVLEGGILRFEPDAGGRDTRVTVDIDADDFTERWFAAVERVS